MRRTSGSNLDWLLNFLSLDVERSNGYSVLVFVGLHRKNYGQKQPSNGQGGAMQLFQAQIVQTPAQEVQAYVEVGSQLYYF